MAKEAAKASKTPSRGPLAHSVGRRKTSVARAWFKRGSGKIRINEEDIKNYFDTDNTILSASTPFRLVPVGANYDVKITVEGGGKVSQADAVKLALSRGLLKLDETLRPVLRKHGLLTVDPRQKERKKYGQKGARRKFQFVKR